MVNSEQLEVAMRGALGDTLYFGLRRLNTRRVMLKMAIVHAFVYGAEEKYAAVLREAQKHLDKNGYII